MDEGGLNDCGAHASDCAFIFSTSLRPHVERRTVSLSSTLSAVARIEFLLATRLPNPAGDAFFFSTPRWSWRGPPIPPPSDATETVLWI